MDAVFSVDAWISLLTLTALEVVLSIDNLVVIAILVGKLPSDRQRMARLVGMTLALVPRLLLLLVIGWVLGLTKPFFGIFGHTFTGKDLILTLGGIFLVYKAVQEIHGSLEGEEEHASNKTYSNVAAVIVQIALINLVFSVDSIVTAVGLASQIWVMAVAVLLSMLVLMAAAGPVGSFVERHPTVKILTLSFLVMIGTTLVADGFGAHFDHAFIYVAMAFALAVEMLNMIYRKRSAKAVQLRKTYQDMIGE